MATVNEKMTAIADALRDKTGEVNPLSLDDMVGEIPKVYEAGKFKAQEEFAIQIPGIVQYGREEERQAFWEQLQVGGTRTAYPYAFAYGAWTDDIYNPIYPIKLSGAAYPYYLSKITDTKVDIIATGSITGAFQGSALKNIRKLIVTEATNFSVAFQNCADLENITFEGVIGNSIDFRQCKKLSADSINSIITHLGGTNSATLTLPSTSRATYDAKFGSGALDALIANKPSNWTITISAK